MNAYVCLSYVQLIRACQLVTSFKEFNDYSDLYLGHAMFNDEKIIKRIKDTKIFRNVIYIDVGKYKKPYIISAYIDFKKNSYVPKEGYKKVISFNIEGVIQTVLFNMNKTRKQFEYHCVEDCPSIYDINVPTKDTKFIYKLLKIQKPCFHIYAWWTSCCEFMKIPEEFTKDIRQLPPIDIENKVFLKKLNYIFDYIEDPILSDTDILIMEESHFIDGYMKSNKDFEFYSKLVNKYNHKKFAIKLHPRTKENRFEGLIPVIKNSNMPWELIVWNRCVNSTRELVQISIRCGTMLSDKMMFDLESKKVILIKLFKDSMNTVNNCSRIDENMINQYELIRDTYRNKENLFIPENEKQLILYFDEMKLGDYNESES